MSSFFDFQLQIAGFRLGRPLVLGHRGAPLELAENSIASFRKALEEGADGVELDVRRTGDDRLVVIHDDMLRSGELLADYSYQELHDLARTHGTAFHSLEEVMRELGGKCFLNIELKELAVETIAVDMALSLLPRSSYVFSSFLPTVVRECRRLAPDVPAILIADSCRDPERIFHLLVDVGASGLGLWHEALTPAVAAIFTSREVPLFVWTVNDPEEARRIATLGVAGIITDLPGEIRGALS